MTSQLRSLILFGVVLAAIVVDVSCGDRTEAPLPSPSSSGTTAQARSPSPAPTTTTPPLPTAKLIFVRNHTGAGYGSLHMANIDGSEDVELVPGEDASYVGLHREPGSGHLTLYYIVRIDPNNYQLRSRNLSSGERREIATLDWQRDYSAPSASLNADASQLAADHAAGVDIITTTLGESRRLLTNDSSGCQQTFDYSRCFSFTRPLFSPDGQLLLVTHGLYESQRLDIVDPGDGNTVAGVPGYQGDWSTTSNAICHTQSVGIDQGAFYLSVAPSWASDTVFGPGNESFESCTWLDEPTVAFVRVTGDDLSQWHVSSLSRTSGQISTLVSGQTPPRPYNLVRINASALIYNTVDTLDPASQVFSQPQLIDINTVAVVPILQPGDVVLGVAETA